MMNNTDFTDHELSSCIGVALSNIQEFVWEDCDDEDIFCFVETPIGEYIITEDVYTKNRYEI